MRSLTIEQLTVGDTVVSRKTVSESDVYLFAGITGDFNPVHMDAEFAKGTPFGARVAHGPLTFSLCAGLIGMELPGVGSVAVTNTVAYRKPVYIGDTITVRVTVDAIETERNRVALEVTWHNQHGDLVADGEMVVKPPRVAVDLR